jgi:hypothetical protein
MAILREMAFHDHRLNRAYYERLGDSLPPPPAPPQRHWQRDYPYLE